MKYVARPNAGVDKVVLLVSVEEPQVTTRLLVAQIVDFSLHKKGSVVGS